jgi:hypothetical protein
LRRNLAPWMSSLIMDALDIGGHPWSSVELGTARLPPRSILNLGMVYFRPLADPP